MDLHGFLRSRHSVRQVLSEPIPAATIDRMLTTAMFAPSAHNRQPWRFAVVATKAGKSQLADSMAAAFGRDLEADGINAAQVKALLEKSQTRINAAPLAIVLCTDMSDMDTYPDARRTEAERAMALQSTANAGMILLLAAHAEGLGAVWICAPLFAPRAVVSGLHLPENWEPQALFLIGRPAESPKARARKAVNEIAVFL